MNGSKYAVSQTVLYLGLSNGLTSMSQRPIKKKDAISAHLNVKLTEPVCQESGGRKMR